MKALLERGLAKGLSGEGISAVEALELTASYSDFFYEILSVTDKIRRKFHGLEVNLCSIVNAKSGLCAEDCSFCAQSVKYNTGVDTFSMAGPEKVLKAALTAEKNGAREFSIVTSGTKVEKESDVTLLENTLSAMRESSEMERCASIGMVGRETLTRLKDAGLESFHHNLETSRSFFPNICTTHDYDDDVAAVRRAKELGLYVCSGGIFGLGESWADRVELAQTLKELDVDSIPVNCLNPRPGTPLAGAANLVPQDCLMIIAILRLILPDKDIVVCGGRATNLRDMQALLFSAGANGMMIGDYLTTPGRDSKADLKMIEDLGLSPKGSCRS